MNSSIPFHEKTKQLIENYISAPTSSCIIVAETSETVIRSATYITDKLLSSKNKAHVLRIKAEKEVIGIELIREIKLKLRNKFSDKKSNINRVLIVENANNMTVEAQNSILKLLEEPPQQTCIILTTTDESKLLETIRSRCQLLRILPLNLNQATVFSQQKFHKDKDVVERVYLLSKGDPALFVDLLTENETTIVANINNAKEFLKNDTFHRLNMFDKYDNVEKFNDLLHALLRVAEAGLHSGQQTNRWKHIAETVRETKKYLSANVGVKLLYMQLSVCI